MRIVDIRIRTFVHKSKRVTDSDGHSHPGPEHDIRRSLLTIVADDGAEGHAFASTELVRPFLIEKFIRPILVGGDPFLREALWLRLARFQRGSDGQLSDRTMAVVDMALHDLCGRALGIPVWKMLGGVRDRIPAYGSIMCGDEMEGGLATPEDYGRYAEWLIERGYRAIKLHTWMPPVSWAPDVVMDAKACAAVREAVGPDIPLMLDANHWYSREEALRLGRSLEALDFYWFEEPMDEYSTSSYKWLCDNLAIPVIGPESAAGSFFTRAEWMARGVCDIARTGVTDAGGIAAALKVARVAESFGMNCEVHGGGAGNLAVLGAMSNGRWYERGLLHPFIDYDETPAYLKSPIDPMDEAGFVALPSGPGLGEDIDFEYVEDNLVSPAV